MESAKGAFNDLRAAVRNEIRDPARATEVTDLVDRLERLMIEAGEARNTHTTRLNALIANYDAPEEDFKAAFREFNAKRISRQDQILAIDQKARTLTTHEEWKAIAKAAAHALEAATRVEQGM
jgi:hypothetical protein